MLLSDQIAKTLQGGFLKFGLEFEFANTKE
jgi:hypothetical protein